MKKFAVLVGAAALASAAQADVILSDSDFANSNWGFESAFSGLTGNTGSASAAQSVATGNPGNARRVTLTTGTSVGDSIYGLSRFGTTNATRYEPATQGPIMSINWTIDARFVTGTFAGAGQAIMLGLKQGTVIYYADYDVTGSSGAWGTFGGTGITAGDFLRLDGAAGSPDLSATGAPIRLGFISGNGNGGFPYSTTVDYDNFSVTVVQVPTPGAATLAGLGLRAVARRKR